MLRQKHKQALFYAGLAGAAIAVLDALVLERYFFQIKRYAIGNLNAKDENSRLKLLLLTDLHLEKIVDSRYTRLAETINQIQPDLILMAGDSVDADGKNQPLDEFLNLLPKQIPKVAILGNHEYKADISLDALRNVYRKHNGDLLVNESKAYDIQGTRFMITGLDDMLNGDANLFQALENVGSERHHLALIHSPLQQEQLRKDLARLNAGRSEADKISISYLFAGHNHGGQVTFFGLFTPILPPKAGEYISGWYNKEKPFLYVSKGFGTSTVPFRFWARAEITLLHYYP
ncbi:metallophosphoesterase [Nibrella viscosa]